MSPCKRAEFTGKFSPNFSLKIIWFWLTRKTFHGKNRPKYARFQFYFLSKFQIFLISSSWAAENMKGSLFCWTFISGIQLELCTVQKQMIAIKENIGEGLILRSFSELTLGCLSSFSEHTCDVLPICRM